MSERIRIPTPEGVGRSPLIFSSSNFFWITTSVSERSAAELSACTGKAASALREGRVATGAPCPPGLSGRRHSTQKRIDDRKFNGCFRGHRPVSRVVKEYNSAKLHWTRVVEDEVELPSGSHPWSTTPLRGSSTSISLPGAACTRSRRPGDEGEGSPNRTSRDEHSSLMVFTSLSA